MIPPLWLANILGWIVAHKRALFVAFLGFVLFLLVVFAYKGCTAREIKLDQKEIIEAQKAIAENDRAKQIEILAKSDAKEQVADDISVNASTNTVNAIKESKDKWNAASDEQIRAELERRAKE